MSPDVLDFSGRAYLSEWMDEPCTYETFRDCLRDLETINRLFLGYRPTERWLYPLLRAARTPLHVVDVGCGGGDLLRRIEHWSRRNRCPVHLTGIDLNPHAARAATELTPPGSKIQWITGDAFSYRPSTPIDLVLSSLFTHHLTDPDIVRFLAWMEQVAAKGWFINDLHRSRTSFHGFRLLAALMRWHPFVQHDGPVSFRRSFSPHDWLAYLQQAGLDPAHVAIQPAAPGRLCLARLKP